MSFCQQTVNSTVVFVVFANVKRGSPLCVPSGGPPGGLPAASRSLARGLGVPPDMSCGLRLKRGHLVRPYTVIPYHQRTARLGSRCALSSPCSLSINRLKRCAFYILKLICASHVQKAFLALYMLLKTLYMWLKYP